MTVNAVCSTVVPACLCVSTDRVVTDFHETWQEYHAAGSHPKLVHAPPTFSSRNVTGARTSEVNLAF